MTILKKFFEFLRKKYLLDDNLRELLKGSSKAFLIKIIGMFLGYIVMLYITNFYGAKEYGEYALGITILSIVLILPRFGLDTALVRIIGEIKQFQSNKYLCGVLKRAFLISLVLSFIIVVLLVKYSDLIALSIFKKEAIIDELDLIIWVIFPSASIFLIAAYFQAYKKVVTYMLLNTVLLNFIFITFLVIVRFLKLDKTPFYLYSVSLITTFLVGVIILLYDLYKKKVGIKKAISKSTILLTPKYNLSKIIRVSSPMLLSSSFVLLINWLDIIMLGILSTEESVGVYNATQRLAAFSGITLLAINSIATPKFVEFFTKKDFKGLEKVVKNSTKLIFFSTTPMLLVFIFLSKSILTFNGPEFVIGYISLIFLCVGKFVNAISGSVGFILQMTNNQKVFQNVLLFAAILNGILNFFLIPVYGFNGAAFASMITISLWNLSLVIIIKRKFGFWTVYLPRIKK